VKRKGSAPDLNMAAMGINEAGPKPKTAAKRGPGALTSRLRTLSHIYPAHVSLIAVTRDLM